MAGARSVWHRKDDGSAAVLNITKKGMFSTRMNHRQTAIIKKWIHEPPHPETRKVMVTDDLPEKVRHLLDMSP